MVPIAVLVGVRPVRDRFMHPSLKELDHRPWPLPARPWRWRQSWLDLAFIHYRVDGDALRAMLPSGVRLQEFGGHAWVGLVPFRMAGVGRRPWPTLPGFTSFPELNLRTYVEVADRPGVWFFSLDAASWPVVFGGRRFYDLPYHSAGMRQEWLGEWCAFSSVRREGGVRFAARYRPLGNPFRAAVGTFEQWATERYCLYSISQRHGLCRVDVHHVPWPLQPAEVVIDECGILSAASLTPLPDPPVCHFSRGVDVVSFGKERVRTP